MGSPMHALYGIGVSTWQLEALEHGLWVLSIVFSFGNWFQQVGPGTGIVCPENPKRVIHSPDLARRRNGISSTSRVKLI